MWCPIKNVILLLSILTFIITIVNSLIIDLTLNRWALINTFQKVFRCDYKFITFSNAFHLKRHSNRVHSDRRAFKICIIINEFNVNDRHVSRDYPFSNFTSQCSSLWNGTLAREEWSECSTEHTLRLQSHCSR